ncbi:C3HC zinc finger-like, putative isoform 2 [Hibiscus syriacus]|uniref:C3HC zinc finger-like, putative isoform 2 n=1 Tax=Hibiscus syriacus TaxID=106335 RepID=A0A6A2ZS45_HIBSY|nr:C3HC zinc finger-like, putative isoform 2 [Hibiscus syriacus]
MANDPEKRFHSIMDKLFHSSSSSPSPPGTGMGRQEQLLRAKKRPNPTYALAAEEKHHGLSASESPLCRPWDRGDLLRRLSTFKSMTWFAKPKVVSAVNCAMRGWVNVDMDILAFEKAASVFSLKLDSGHKLICPWIDNACDEKLAEFPPTVPADLVDKFRARSNSLFQLIALPVISSSAIESMRSPQLEEFLRQPLMVDCLKGNAEFSQFESIEDGSAVDSANLYYQAQKLVSLCGWEPCPLPYVVNFKDGQNQFVKDAETLSSPQGVDYGLNLCLNFHAADENENLETNKDSGNRLQYDPKSVVLDCRLCGASVGLWAFSTVQQPVEFFRLFVCEEVNPGVHDSGHKSNVCDGVPSNGGPSPMEQSSDSKLTIAGGPLPAQQNFKARICLPVIGQSLRARFLYHPEFRDQIYSNQENTPVESQFLGEIECFNTGVSEPGVPSAELRTSNRKKDGQVNCSSKSNDQSPCSNHDACARDDNFRNVTPLEGTNITAKEISPYAGTDDSNLGVQIESSQNVVQDSCQTVKNSDTTHIGDSSIMIQAANVSPRNEGTKDNDSSVTILSEQCHPEQFAETEKVCDEEICLSNQNSTCVASCVEAYVNVDGAYKMTSREDKTCANSEERMIPEVQTAQTNKVLSCPKGKDVQQHMDKISEFDPIRQHRHFCPWIVSMSGGAPGWKQTLSALQSGKDFPHSSPACSPSPPSASMIRVDDPIASVRKLFLSPVTKRMKTS